MKLSVPNAVALMFSISVLVAFTSFVPVKQGIEGYVYMVTGNQMPTIGVKRPASKGIRTTLYIYELTNTSQVVKPDESPFYSSINTKLVRRVTSNSKGYFSVQLPPGRYSVFARKGSLYFSNIFDDKNNIFPVQVLPKKMAKVEFTINYNAVY